MTHFYRPVIDVYFGVMTPLLRGSPVLFHEASIVLHIVNVLVVFALARRIGGSDWFGWAAALSEAIGALFGCLSLLWFLSWREDPQPRWLRLSVVAFALALLTHESSVVFLGVLFLANWLLVGRRDLIRPFVPYLIVTGAYLALD